MQPRRNAAGGKGSRDSEIRLSGNRWRGIRLVAKRGLRGRNFMDEGFSRTRNYSYSRYPLTPLSQIKT